LHGSYEPNRFCSAASYIASVFTGTPRAKNAAFVDVVADDDRDDRFVAGGIGRAFVGSTTLSAIGPSDDRQVRARVGIERRNALDQICRGHRAQVGERRTGSQRYTGTPPRPANRFRDGTRARCP